MDIKKSRHPVLSRLLRIFLATQLAMGMLSVAAIWGTPSQAYAVTSAEKQAEVEEAFRRLDALQTEINQLADDYDVAMAAYETAEANKLEAQAREEAARERVHMLQEQLSDRAAYMYRNGNVSYLDVLFGAQSFTDFISAMDLINRVNEQDAQLVLETKLVRDEAEAARLEYTEQERLAQEKLEEIATIMAAKEAAEVELLAEIELLKKEAAELLAQEEAAAEAARQAAMAYAASNNNGPVNEEQMARVYALGVRYPFNGSFPVTSPFGWRAIFGDFHYGCDWGMPTGTPILAIAGGTVVAVGYGGSMGNYVIIAHGNGIRSIYMHNSSLNVSAGQSVSQGEVISYAGSTGNSTGPHLHLQIEVDLIPINPQIFLP